MDRKLRADAWADKYNAMKFKVGDKVTYELYGNQVVGIIKEVSRAPSDGYVSYKVAVVSGGKKTDYSTKWFEEGILRRA